MSRPTVRVRFRMGPKTTDYTDTAEPTPLEQIIKKISNLLAIPDEHIKNLRLEFGAPTTQTILTSDLGPEQTLQDVGIKSGELVRVTDLSASPSISEKSPIIKKQPETVIAGRHRVIRDDNSCIFNAVAHGCNPVDPIPASTLRELVVSAIRSDPERFNDITLDMPREKYMRRILEPDFWGGSTELTIMSEFYEIEIYIWNIETLSTIKYGEGKNYSRRVILFYNGVHYDTFVRKVVQKDPTSSTSTQTFPGSVLKQTSTGTHESTSIPSRSTTSSFANKNVHGLRDRSSAEDLQESKQARIQRMDQQQPPENVFKAVGLAKDDQTPFSVTDTLALDQSKAIAQYLQLQRYHFNLNKDSILCEICGAVFKGQTEATVHASKTGHQAFQQI